MRSRSETGTGQRKRIAGTARSRHAMSARADTRRHLVDMRERLIGNLDARIEGGDLALLAAVNGALSAIDAEGDHPAPIDAEPAARAIVVDIPGEPVGLTLYSQEGRVAAVDLAPGRAIALAGELIRAALPRLPQ
jgi:hypothetical protein